MEQKNCKHSITYWGNQYGDSKNVYVIRSCIKCGLTEKGKIGKFKKATEYEKAIWKDLKMDN